MIDARRILWAVFILGTAAFLCLFVLVVKALAHDAPGNWYPYECCGGYDCGPAVMETVPAATLASLTGAKGPSFISTVTVTFTAGPDMGKKETVVVPDDFPRRESKDGRMHGCIVGGHIRCLFIPPTG